MQKTSKCPQCRESVPLSSQGNRVRHPCPKEERTPVTPYRGVARCRVCGWEAMTRPSSGCIRVHRPTISSPECSGSRELAVMADGRWVGRKPPKTPEQETQEPRIDAFHDKCPICGWYGALNTTGLVRRHKSKNPTEFCCGGSGMNPYQPKRRVL